MGRAARAKGAGKAGGLFHVKRLSQEGLDAPDHQ